MVRSQIGIVTKIPYCFKDKQETCTVRTSSKTGNHAIEISNIRLSFIYVQVYRWENDRVSADTRLTHRSDNKK